MANTSPIIPSVIAGAIAGAIVSFLFLQNPSYTPSTSVNTGAVTTDPSIAATAYEEAIIAATDAAQPAVVSILVTKDLPVFEQFSQQIPNPFGDFFGAPFEFRAPQLRERGTQEQEVGGGSGFIVSEDGMIISNRHVVSDPDAAYTVFLNDGTQYDATVIARDPVNDIAVLDIDADNLPYLEFADSDTLRVGQSVIAIGNALGEFRNTVSAGVVSGLSRSITAGDAFGQTEQLEEVLQTDAAINPGNSGGPLLDLHGRVVGVNVAVALGSENIGFALPSNLVQAITQSVQETGRIIRPYLGVRYTIVTPAIAEANNLPVEFGALIISNTQAGQLGVIPGSPADQADLREGDIILSIDGEDITETRTLASIVRTKEVGDTITMTVRRGDDERQVSTTLAEFPED